MPAIDLDPALGHLPGVPHAGVEQRRFSQAVARGTGDSAELAGLAARDREGQLSDAPNVQAEGLGWSGATGGEGPARSEVGQELRDLLAGGEGHRV